MTLRGRSLLAQIPALVLLGIVAIWGVRTADRLSANTSHILEDNYRSVLAAQRMKESIERIDSAALFLVAGEEQRGRAQIAENRAPFEAELATEEANITEEGEARTAAALRHAWEDYSRTLDAFAARPPDQRTSGRYFDELLPRFLEVKHQADAVLALNQDAMLRRSDAARAEAARLREALVVASAGALILAFVLGTWAGGRVIRGVGVLATGARRIGNGDLDHSLPVEGSDELAALAEEFNRMTASLRAYRRSSEGEVAQAREASMAAIDSLLDPVLVVRADGSVRAINRAMGVVAGQGDPGDPTPDALARAIDVALDHVLSGRGPYLPADFQSAVTRGERTFLPRATPIYDKHSMALAGATVVLQDVTRLRRLDELKSDLVHTVAHELRTPLTSLGMAVHLSLDERVTGPLSSERADLLEAAREDVERLQRLVADLLDLSRLQEGAIELHREPVDLSTLIGEAMAGQAESARARSATLILEDAQRVPPLSLDRERMALVLSNLLSNALRHTPVGGRVRVAVTQEEGRVSLCVQDEGPGVPAELRDRVFDRFFRVPGDESAGTGLGLSIVREIVGAHGGRVSVRDAPEGGALFVVDLPVETH